MAAADIIKKAHTKLYSAGLGERPSVVRAAADANEGTVSNGVLTVDLLAGEGSKTQAGDVLSVRNPATAATAYVMEVLSVATDTVTVLNDIGPALAGGNDGALDNAILEVAAPITGYQMWNSLETIFDDFLHPEVMYRATETVTPNLATCQVGVPADVDTIIAAYQRISNITVPLPFSLEQFQDTSVWATGQYADIGFYDGSTTYLTVWKRYTSTTASIPDSVEELVAIGIAALAADSDVFPSNLETASKESQTRGMKDVASKLWRSFYTMRQEIAQSLSEDVEYFEIVR